MAAQPEEDRLIFARFPELRSRLRPVPLAALPSPVRPMPASIAPNAWMKCDGLTHARNGGSKIRALEFFIGEARAWKRPVFAYGPEGSGWLIGLARFGPAAGLVTRILTFPQFRTPTTLHKRALLAEVAGRSLTRGRDYAEFALLALAAVPRIVGGTWEAAPPGGSDAVSTLGYVNAALELASQVECGECPRPDAIFVPVGSGGLAAGLTLGVGILGWTTEIVGVSIAPRLIANRTAVLRLAIQSSWLLNRRDLPIAALRVVHRYAGSYAAPTPAGDRAQSLFAAHGIECDPVYTAKLAAAFVEMAPHFRQPLLWHTYAKPVV